MKDLNSTYQERKVVNEIALFLGERLRGEVRALENKFNVIIEELKSEEDA